MTKDPYAALGLTKEASADDIKKAYRKIARTDHPDLNPDDPRAEARFKVLLRVEPAGIDLAQRRYPLFRENQFLRAAFVSGALNVTRVAQLCQIA